MRDEIDDSVVPWQFDSSSCSTVGVLPMLRREAAVERAIETVGAERCEGTGGGAVEAVGAVGAVVIHCPDGASF